MNRNEGGAYPSSKAPILGHESHAEPPVFTPANLLREASGRRGSLTDRSHGYACWIRTGTLSSIEGDFEKGAANGSADALRVIGATAERWLAWSEQVPANLPDR